MLDFEATAEIDAPPEEVWRVLVDVAGYPNWSSGVTAVKGTLVEGGQLTIHTEISPDREFKVKVAELTRDERMVWQSGMPFGLFRAGRAFNLTLIDDNRTYFQTREVFSGRLLPVFKRKIPDLNPSLRKFAEGLKAETEQRRRG